jgi:integrase/recombinase XerD
MCDLIAQFLDHIAYERGLSANTRSAYEADLAAFWGYLDMLGAKPDFRQVTRDHIAGFLSDQRGKKMSAATVARRLVAIRIFFAFLQSEGHVTANVTEVMATPRKGRVLPRTLSEADVARLLVSVSGERALDIRDRCMIELFYACGLRVSEVTALRIGDVRIPDGVLRCVGKGDKQRLIPLGSEACRWVERYLSQARPSFAHGCGTEPALFLTRRGEPFTRQGIYDMLKKRARAAQISVPLSPHVLRHCFASHLLAHGAHVRAIQEMLGHADIATTQIYTHVDVEHVTRTHARFHPRHAGVRSNT